MKKKIIVMMLAACIAAGNLSGCGGTASDPGSSETEKSETENAETAGGIVNAEYNEKGMTTLGGTTNKLNGDNLLMFKTAGFGFDYPECWDELKNPDGLDPVDYSPEAFVLYYMPTAEVEKISSLTDNMTDEEYDAAYEEAYDSEYTALVIYRVNPNEEETSEYEASIKEETEKSEMLGTDGINTWYIAYNITLPEEGFSDDDIADLQVIQDSIETIKSNLMLFTPSDPLEDFQVDLTSFTAEDQNGNEVTEEIFADYDVTMINIWTTWCQYCVEEMPAIEKLYESKAENVNIISICMDASDEEETFASELEQTGITFTTLKGNYELEENIIPYLSGYPTTFFVDSDGKLIGQLQIGSPGESEDEIISEYQSLINSALGQ